MKHATTSGLGRLSLRQKLLFSTGDLSTSIPLAIIMFFQLYFLTDVAGLRPDYAGWAVGAGRASRGAREDLAMAAGEVRVALLGTGAIAQIVHLPVLAPTQDMLDRYKKKGGDWKTYEREFIDLMKGRRIEDMVSKDVLADGCLLCSEDKPHHCHRRLVAEYLKERWGDVDIVHLT